MFSISFITVSRNLPPTGWRPAVRPLEMETLFSGYHTTIGVGTAFSSRFRLIAGLHENLSGAAGDAAIPAGA